MLIIRSEVSHEVSRLFRAPRAAESSFDDHGRHRQVGGCGDRGYPGQRFEWLILLFHVREVNGADDHKVLQTPVE